MKEYIFETKYDLDFKVDNINDVVLDHNFNYEYSNNGVNIKGDILILFNACCEENVISCNNTCPVELFVSLNEIDSLKDISLDIDNFNYVIDEKSINFKINTKLKGNKEDFVFFELSPNKKINDTAISLLLRNIKKNDRVIKMPNEELKKIEKIIKSSSVDLISTAFESIGEMNDIIEFSTIDEKETPEVINENEEIITENRELKEEIIEKEELNFEEHLLSKENKIEQEREIKLEQVKEIKPEKIKIIPKKEELFKETYESKYLYYVVKNNETSLDIIKKFNVDEKEFNQLNKNIEIKKGSLIRIPR